ncbi:DUF2384 domain-containing protein [Methylobacterium sp. WL18]|uniref:antitoxin Xre/MbcA/ParS toxin-binding domain-containing protein n=1 Tax=Methylobacterium sp. WL18 TaxID=2603897 RepID=UPI0011CC005D|nr:antitoxin Xre/MbcA/ParS toxin-binding domain-containing protein [Methylobacterium sp. WL18]TXN62907.1 DUF2384 domain-containing protein [Methylobacterium sp. WL18]
MTNDAMLVDLLGVGASPAGTVSTSEIVKRVREGLPVQALERVATAVAPKDRNFRFSLVKKATLTRRNAPQAGSARLSELEGAKVVRLARVWALACEVWKDEDAARAFLHRPHALLEGRPPIDIVMESEFGGPRVEAILGRLQVGSVA